MDADKVMDEEEEEEKEQFFSDLVASDGRDEEEEEEDLMGDEDMDEADADADASMSTGSESGATPAAAPAGPKDAAAPSAMGGPSERRAMVGASPYVAPFTPLSSPNQPKTPSSVTAAQRMGTGGTGGNKKPQLIPMKNGGGGGFATGGASAKVLKDDITTHLPDALVDALVNTVQTLDKLIVGVEDFKADQLGFLTDKVNAYVDLLKRVDAAGANYDALIPLGVLEMLNGDEHTNPELFTKAQLEKCQDESDRAASKVDTLELLKRELDAGFAELQ